VGRRVRDLGDLGPHLGTVEGNTHTGRRALHSVEMRVERAWHVVVQTHPLKHTISSNKSIVQGYDRGLALRQEDSIDHKA
jgi:hypothetical protein